MTNVTIHNFTTRWEDNDHVTFVALTAWGDKENEIIGTVMLNFHGDRKRECLLWNLNVTQAARTQGLGTRLLTAAVDFAAERGIKEISLEWDARDTDGWTLDWYKRQGFRVTSRYGSGTSIRLTKTLKKSKS